ncbi:dihydrofolate reductase family protein [Oryzifoliimicrobium ureilyticus]|uniref:dihydrofolate reductase family protein n=1 Tax=Oryzifoliimicrobium ureilyticus TaxID=3113724 RepID=UPI00307600F5
MKPYIICLMLTSPDGSLHPSRWTSSPDGTKADWSKLYEKIHAEHHGNAWMVGRVTMAEISKAEAHPPQKPVDVERPFHIARRDAGSCAIAIDKSGKLHFSSGELYGDHVIVLLGADVPDSHLAELAADGVSYLVSEHREMDIAKMLDWLGREFGIKRLLLEGGAAINGSLLAAGLVDELSFLIAPALEARSGSDRVVEFGTEGLGGKTSLSLISCETLSYGALHVRYKVHPPV